MARLFKAKGYLTGKLIDECPYAPGQSVLLQQFGSIHRVYELVGFQPSGWWRPPGQDRPVTKEEMLAALRRLFERDGYVTEATINADPSVPSAPDYQYKFGKLTNAYRLAGLPYKQGDLQRLGFERLRARREGDPPRDEAYMLHLGRVEVRKRVGDEQRVLRVMKKGELLGELGLFGKSPRSATAVALEPVTLVVIPVLYFVLLQHRAHAPR